MRWLCRKILCTEVLQVGIEVTLLAERLGMARLAICWETHGCVIGIGCRCVIGLMAGNALLRCGLEHLVLVARRALCRQMRSREGKRGLCMVEPLAPHQCRYLMALNAVRGKPGGRVIGSLRLNVVATMTAKAIDWCTGVLFLRGIRMARLTTQRCVPSEQWKSS